MGMNALPPLPAADLDHVLSHTRDLWDAVRDRRLLITGGTGFFGRWLLESFLRANDRMGLNSTVTVLSRDPGAFDVRMPHIAAHKSVRLAGGDMCTCEMKGERFDFVIHAAAEPLPQDPTADPLLPFERNVAGTKNALEIARCCGARRFLLTSSGAVYGRQPADLARVPEDYRGAPDALDPLTTYGQAKRVSEFLCASYARRQGLQAVVARCFAFVGPHLPLDANYAVGNFIRDALRGGPIQVTGDGTPRRSYLYAADLAAWLWTILFRGEAGRAYNVGSDADLSIRELADEVRKVVAPQAEVKIAKRAAPDGQVERYVPSIQRARTELGLDIWTSLPDAIARTAGWSSRP
jgi:nucleoside-diphosphate-sugar epimerase